MVFLNLHLSGGCPSAGNKSFFDINDCAAPRALFRFAPYLNDGFSYSEINAFFIQFLYL